MEQNCLSHGAHGAKLLFVWSNFPPQSMQKSSCGAKLLHIKIFSPRTMSAAFATNIMYVVSHSINGNNPDLSFSWSGLGICGWWRRSWILVPGSWCILNTWLIRINYVSTYFLQLCFRPSEYNHNTRPECNQGLMSICWRFIWCSTLFGTKHCLTQTLFAHNFVWHRT